MPTGNLSVGRPPAPDEIITAHGFPVDGHGEPVGSTPLLRQDDPMLKACDHVQRIRRQLDDKREVVIRFAVYNLPEVIREDADARILVAIESLMNRRREIRDLARLLTEARAEWGRQVWQHGGYRGEDGERVHLPNAPAEAWTDIQP